MSKLGIYTFLPWLRQGIANQITQADDGAAGSSRATVNVTLRITGKKTGGGDEVQDIVKPVQLYGPGDIVGIDAKAIVKTEPRNWITNFETNYLPGIDFYDEDFPWRYTPAAPDAATKSRLRPWIMLVVLKEDEFTDGVGVAGRPLPYVVVEDLTVFPKASDLWAWAHVHVNRGLIAAPGDVFVGANENGAVLDGFEDTLAEDPDLAYSRILCPRQLEPDTGYHAFLMPVFETGRLAGLGMDPETAPGATASAWEAAGRPEGTSFPYYYRWYFRTSTVGDFEYLVRLLKPQPMDRRVGRRPMDVQDPGVNLPGIDDADLGGILKLGGALQIPEDTLGDEDRADVQKYENWDEPYPHVFQQRLAEFINLTDDYARQAAAAANAGTGLPDSVRTNPDPLITAPLYGRWHALTERLLKDPAGDPLPQTRNWVHELNLDPRFRTAAGFGTRVVQQNQETYMEAAWKQVGDVLKANQQIKWAQLAVQTSWVWYETHLKPIQAQQPDQFFALTAPLDRRVLVDGKTRFFVQKASPVPRAVVAAPMRRIARPRSRAVTKLGFPAGAGPMAMVSRINAGEIHPAPPKVTPPSLPTPDQIADAAQPTGLPGFLLDWLRRARWLRWLFLAIALIILILLLLFVGPDLAGLTPGLGSLAGIALAVAIGLLWLFQRSGRVIEQQEAADTLGEDSLTPDAVNTLPRSPNFVLTPIDAAFEPVRGGSDSAEATRFKAGLSGAFELIQASKAVSALPTPVPMDLPAVSRQTFVSIDPAVTIPRRTLVRVIIPDRIKGKLIEQFVEAMAYPEFDTPMYKPLVDLSSELFLPNIQFVAENSISLLETNQRFIESYMVGLNHEFGRELLWREYPTDQRGSYFRQFWDVSSFLDRTGADPEALKESLRDIPPIHRWSKFSNLGDHDNREKPGENEEELVLVIRGELLKKYPTAVIYAQRAAWEKKGDGTPDKTKPRRLIAVTPAEEENPPESKIRTPLYEAKVDPDIYFFGFDLTALEAKGETEEDPDDPGWFFVIKERPGEPRFGLDVDQDGEPGGTKNVWNDLSWTDVGVAPGSFLAPLPPPAVTLEAPAGSPLPQLVAQHNEDIQIPWNASVSAAEMAYILYQVPVLVGVHASEMLPDV
ncbi:MAG: hypothetical protein R2834_11760 [Rhodothermales bacterium]